MQFPWDADHAGRTSSFDVPYGIFNFLIPIRFAKNVKCKRKRQMKFHELLLELAQIHPQMPEMRQITHKK
ncbi:hypothetical protein N7E02_08550 [Aliirhizobium terrae]|uniref:hypothetical protein n=1 Tax=Terrirhizobium terrae TaxID=2926709 RepID=UPI002575A42D|nr:hypothetical protein [Rhizobium sp. CC-CFT758]WJH40646.1 hypothetical protein N7E02_08550 [Rhizobium sp. CC-CFT758]